MALAPRASLRSMVLLLSHGKPRLSSLFSSIPTATPGAADTPAAPADQAPPGPAPREGSSCHRSHKRSSKKHLNHKVCEDPDLGVAGRGTRMSSKDEPPHQSHQPVGRIGIRNDAIHKHSIPDASCSALQPLPDKLRKNHPDHKVGEDGDFPFPGRSSSRDDGKITVPEPTGRTRIGIANRPPTGSCSTLQHLPDKLCKEHPDHKVGEDGDLPASWESSSHDDPDHTVPEPTGRKPA